MANTKIRSEGYEAASRLEEEAAPLSIALVAALAGAVFALAIGSAALSSDQDEWSDDYPPMALIGP
jgi:hypothetical protein